VPRNEKPDGMAGGKAINVARVEWRTMPDTSTAMSALQTGQMDWLETTSPDLLSLVAKQRDITVTTLDPIGSYVLLRFNSLVPPFDDVAMRKAVLHAVNRADYLDAMVATPSSAASARRSSPAARRSPPAPVGVDVGQGRRGAGDAEGVRL
jgi:peptide/nickel transport system substrate-binding protein